MLVSVSSNTTTALLSAVELEELTIGDDRSIGSASELIVTVF